MRMGLVGRRRWSVCVRGTEVGRSVWMIAVFVIGVAGCSIASASVLGFRACTSVMSAISGTACLTAK